MRCRPSGPTPCEVLFVGEAPGQEEDAIGLPFIGHAGKELRQQLSDAGFKPGSKAPMYSDQEVRMTNVFLTRPPKNDLDHFCGKRADVGKEYSLPALAQGKWVLHQYLGDLEALKEEINSCRPRLIVALGNTPCWALLRRTGISKLRGSIFPCELVPGIPVLPTFHPSYVLRAWEERVIALHDLMKARRFLLEGFNPPRRSLLLEPTISEVRDFCQREILDRPPPVLSFDVETAGDFVTCIGFAPRADLAITIPFYDPAKPDRNYWGDPKEELRPGDVFIRFSVLTYPNLDKMDYTTSNVSFDTVYRFEDTSETQ